MVPTVNQRKCAFQILAIKASTWGPYPHQVTVGGQLSALCGNFVETMWKLRKLSALFVRIVWCLTPKISWIHQLQTQWGRWSPWVHNSTRPLWKNSWSHKQSQSQSPCTRARCHLFSHPSENTVKAEDTTWSTEAWLQSLLKAVYVLPNKWWQYGSILQPQKPGSTTTCLR